MASGRACIWDDAASCAATQIVSQLMSSTTDNQNTHPSQPSSEDQGDKPFQIITSTTDEVHEVQDRGLRAWIVLSGAFIIEFTTYGLISSWGVFQAYYSSNILKDNAPSSIAWIGSLQVRHWFPATKCSITRFPSFSPQCSLALFVIAAIGRLYDLGYLRSLLLSGCAMLVVATLLVAECHVLWHFMLCQGILSGVAVGIGSGLGVMIITDWFDKYRGMALGIAYAASSLGGILIPLAIRYLLPALGFQWSVRLIALVFAGASLFTCLTLRRRLVLGAHRGSKNRVSWSVFRSPQYTIYCVGIFFVYLGYNTLPWYVSTTAQTLGFSETLVFSIVSFYNASSCIGRLIGGVAADRFGSMNIQIPTMICAAVIAFLWPLATDTSSLIAVSVLYGLFSGAYVALEAYPVVKMSDNLGDAGLLIGLTYIFAGSGALLSLPIPASLASSVGIQAAGSFAGGAILAGVICICITRRILLKGFLGIL
ncbi:MFS general substrate transporter [Marasmius fiardii PR-910]|nr:MFS general substrate transporter [Marasmius fiardii PR-910]